MIAPALACSANRAKAAWAAPALGLQVTVQSEDGGHPTHTTGEVSWLERDGSFVLACGDDDDPALDIVGFEPGTSWHLAADTGPVWR